MVVPIAESYRIAGKLSIDALEEQIEIWSEVEDENKMNQINQRG